jgi:hypothetical protein
MSPHFLLMVLGSALLSTSSISVAADRITLSPETRGKLRSVLPHYTPTIAGRPDPGKARPRALSRSPNVALSPRATVQERILRRMKADAFYEQGVFDRELVKRELSVLDRYFLNRFTLPLFGVSQETRARQAYLERQHRQFRNEVNAFARVVALTNPQEAASLRACLAPGP